MNKEEIRSFIKNERLRKRREEKEVLREGQRIIAEKYLNSKVYKEAETILIFNSTDLEFDTTRIVRDCFRNGKAVFMPRVTSKVADGGEMEFIRICPDTRYFEVRGIMEPEEGEVFIPFLSPVKTEVVIPGLAFDRFGNRIGYGGGYYDRYFSRNARAFFHLTALCFDFQLFDSISVEGYDASVDCIITESEEIYFIRN